MQKQYYVYILTGKTNRVLYVGVTNDLIRRVYEHRQHAADSFTSRYGLDKLVYFEAYDDPYNAISREKQIKGGSREKKLALINGSNPGWDDLWVKIQ